MISGLSMLSITCKATSNTTQYSCHDLSMMRGGLYEEIGVITTKITNILKSADGWTPPKNDQKLLNLYDKELDVIKQRYDICKNLITHHCPSYYPDPFERTFVDIYYEFKYKLMED